jgi:hypothetical protein
MAPTLSTGDTLTIEATVLHVVDLGGGETNYCLELPSGRTTWVLASQLDGVSVEDEPKAPTEAPETKVVTGPPARKAPARKRASASA